MATPMQQENLDSSELSVASYIQPARTTSALFIWTVRNYSKLDKDILYHQTNDETKCTFKLMKTTQTLFIAIYNNCSRTYMKFYLLGVEDEVYACEGKEILECVYFGEFCSKMVSDRKKKFLVDDTIHIHCVYYIKQCEGKNTVVPYGQWRYKCCMDDLRNALSNLYTTSNDYDFTIKAEDRIFKVHKLILIARSKYFSDFLQSDMTKSVDLDVSADRLHDVLRYIYTGELKELNVDDMIKIYEISKKLQVKGLSDKCEEFLKANLDISNTLKIAKLASEHNDEGLRISAFSYFGENMLEFEKRDDFEEAFNVITDSLENYPLLLKLAEE